MLIDTHLHFQCWRAAEATCCFSAGACAKWAGGCGYWCYSLFQAGSTKAHWGYCLGWRPPCHNWREANPARHIRTLRSRRRTLKRCWRQRELTQILCLLIIRSMSSLIFRYFSSDSGLWPAESSASISGLSQPFKPFLRSVWRKENTSYELSDYNTELNIICVHIPVIYVMKHDATDTEWWLMDQWKDNSSSDHQTIIASMFWAKFQIIGCFQHLYSEGFLHVSVNKISQFCTTDQIQETVWGSMWAGRKVSPFLTFTTQNKDNIINQNHMTQL